MLLLLKIIGKFPDKNVVEALQRVWEVQGDRSRRWRSIIVFQYVVNLDVTTTVKLAVLILSALVVLFLADFQPVWLSGVDVYINSLAELN